MYVPFGSFVDAVDEFDANLFGMAAGEALALDPQARILLENTQVSVPPLSAFAGTVLLLVPLLFPLQLQAIEKLPVNTPALHQ